MLLDKLKRNAIFKAIDDAGLDLNDFELDNEVDEARVSLRGSESAFVLRRDGSAYSGTELVGEWPPREFNVYIWPAVKQRVTGWLDKVKRDLETPDPWTELRQQREMERHATCS